MIVWIGKLVRRVMESIFPKQKMFNSSNDHGCLSICQLFHMLLVCGCLTCHCHWCCCLLKMNICNSIMFIFTWLMPHIFPTKGLLSRLPKPDTSEMSGSIKLPLCDVIITVQSILCSVTPLFAWAAFSSGSIWFGGLLCLRNNVFLGVLGGKICCFFLSCVTVILA